MMVFVIGGSGSGKSDYGEKEIGLLCGKTGMEKYYVATMKVFDEEGRKRVDRHRRMRSGKGFITIEQPVDIDKVMEKTGSEPPAILVECISNLTANEMFSGEESRGRPESAEETAGKVIREMEVLKKAASHLIVVSCNVFEDGIVYEETVMEYIRAMGRINGALAAMADRVVEVVVGIPLIVKEAEGKTVCR